jgi:hypothetical protein
VTCAADWWDEQLPDLDYEPDDEPYELYRRPTIDLPDIAAYTAA